MSPQITRLAERIAASERVGVLTGAGISAESGVPTFRDPGGLWAQFKPEELANMRAFLANPTLVQEWYAHRRAIIESVRPNAGHMALVALEDLVPEFSLVTQNVDNLHQVAGHQSVLELHGNLTRNHCIDCRTDAPDEVLADTPPLRCERCQGLIRPDVVWFGEMLPPGVFEAAHTLAVECDVFLSIGTSAVVYPAADLPLAAARSGAYAVEINVAPSAISDAMSDTIIGPAGVTLPAIVEQLQTVRAA